MMQFLGSRVGESGLKLNSEAWDDVLLVPGFSIGCKAGVKDLSKRSIITRLAFHPSI